MFQVRHIYMMVDHLTSKFMQKVSVSPDDDNSNFQEHLTAVCTQTLDTVRQCHDTNKSTVIERHLQDMMRINAELLSLETDCELVSFSCQCY